MFARNVYFDGETAGDHVVQVAIAGEGLAISGQTLTACHWPFDGLALAQPRQEGAPLRLTHRLHPAARLLIADPEVARLVLERLPRIGELKAGIGPSGHGLIWIGVGLVGMALIFWLVLQVAPGPVAALMPESWRHHIGQQVEATLVDGAKPCAESAGMAALARIFGRLAEGGELPATSIAVYAIPMTNAFAVPGERVIITHRLITDAETPEEVAGVLAHELGHARHRHSESQIVRALGLQLAIAILTGGGGNDLVSSMAGLSAILTYSREAETEADEFAGRQLIAAGIDPQGLKEFFTRLLDEEKRLGGSGRTFGQALSTHPATAERIARIPAMPEGAAAREVLDEASWNDLRNICG